MADDRFDFRDLNTDELPGGFVVIITADKIEFFPEGDQCGHQVVKGLVAVPNGDRFSKHKVAEIIAALSVGGLTPASVNAIEFQGSEMDADVTDAVLLFLCHKRIRV